ncbi:hypothetical protein EMIHUDRAFT_454228 [Emiliania huxleyi CCMP1516]|uniref:Uncharacterized protein n=2 Tax=Emiliania huxleyi TaxID=2903 RepID=A0A0D3KXR7_EMIH1|nr:hypothetical protein EMIHUDRAFT_454228 [Emiliania huxleyi CCMP1516]EOD40552.1 hypothetical protein EMIHUDRAFT_454228 [Emiliania huxleyi CCMP1516]|eukprot:XP_005792981.1 hypothetical protein EMIHUDRAFT_454228 [Emiliania huxleyi CCMP1516]
MLSAAVHVATTAASPQLAQLLSRATDLETSGGDTTSGIHGPFPLSTDGWRECVAGWEHVQKKWKSLGLIAHPYPKSAHAHVPACRALAMQPALLREMRAVIGTDDLMLATMSVLVKEVGWEHRWHTDVENAIDRTRCNDTSWTAKLHKQCKVCEGGDFSSLWRRGGQLAKVARREVSPHAALVQLAAADTQAWAFRGATWHASFNNASSRKTRTAVQMHFMPTRCKFRSDTGLENAPELPTSERQRPPGIGAVLPPVIPLQGKASATLRGSGEEATHNNWMFPDEPEPAVVDATFDRTPKRKRDCAAATFAPETPLKSLAHDLNAGGWVDKLCKLKSGVDARAGIVDKSKCKTHQLTGHSAGAPIMEYHTSKLRKNFAAHEMRTHEEIELVYAVYLAIRFLGNQPVSVEERETDSVVVWRRSDTAESDLAEAGHDQLLLATRGEVLYGGADGKMRTLTAPGTLFVPAGAPLTLSRKKYGVDEKGRAHRPLPGGGRAGAAPTAAPATASTHPPAASWSQRLANLVLEAKALSQHVPIRGRKDAGLSPGALRKKYGVPPLKP